MAIPISNPDDSPNIQESPCLDPEDPACHLGILQAIRLAKRHIDTAVEHINPERHGNRLRQALEKAKLHIDSAHEAAAELTPKR